jgi:hypothetical protein
MRKQVIALVALSGVVFGAQAATPAGGAPPGAGNNNNGFQQPLVVPVCTRATLIAAVDGYLAAQKSGNAGTIAFAGKATYLENMAAIEPAKGLWNKALPIAHTRSFYDAKRCKTFTEIVVTEGGHPYVIGTRLYVDAGKVTRIDSMVTDEGDWLFNANAYLKYSKGENWNITAAQRTPAEAMINGANAYLDLFSDKFRDAPWGQPCARLEGGAYTNRPRHPDGTDNPDGVVDFNNPNSSCRTGIPNGILYIVNRDYVVDEEQGVVNVFCRFGNSQTGLPDSHTFMFVNGKYRWVHTLNAQPDPPPGGEPAAAPPAQRAAPGATAAPR